MTCPTECQEHIQRLYACSWPAWTRAILISLIGVIFATVAWMYSNEMQSFATKEEVREVRQELRQELKDANAKLDLLLTRGK